MEASNWDLLDAMVYLEKQGKVKPPSQESYTTNCDEQTQYVDVKEKVQEQEEEASRKTCQKLGRVFRIFIGKNQRQCFLCLKKRGGDSQSSGNRHAYSSALLLAVSDTGSGDRVVF